MSHFLNDAKALLTISDVVKACIEVSPVLHEQFAKKGGVEQCLGAFSENGDDVDVLRPMGTVLLGVTKYDEAKKAIVSQGGIRLFCETLRKYLDLANRDELVCRRCLQVLCRIAECADYRVDMVKEELITLCVSSVSIFEKVPDVMVASFLLISYLCLTKEGADSALSENDLLPLLKERMEGYLTNAEVEAAGFAALTSMLQDKRNGEEVTASCMHLELLPL